MLTPPPILTVWQSPRRPSASTTPRAQSTAENRYAARNAREWTTERFGRALLVANRRGAEHIKRPVNAFMLFRMEYSEHNSRGPGSRRNGPAVEHVSTRASAEWHALNADERKFWERCADVWKELHAQRFPTYRFAPRRLRPALVGTPMSRASFSPSPTPSSPALTATSSLPERSSGFARRQNATGGLMLNLPDGPPRAFMGRRSSSAPPLPDGFLSAFQRSLPGDLGSNGYSSMPASPADHDEEPIGWSPYDTLAAEDAAELSPLLLVSGANWRRSASAAPDDGMPLPNGQMHFGMQAPPLLAPVPCPPATDFAGFFAPSPLSNSSSLEPHYDLPLAEHLAPFSFPAAPRDLPAPNGDTYPHAMYDAPLMFAPAFFPSHVGPPYMFQENLNAHDDPYAAY